MNKIIILLIGFIIYISVLKEKKTDIDFMKYTEYKKRG